MLNEFELIHKFRITPDYGSNTNFIDNLKMQEEMLDFL